MSEQEKMAVEPTSPVQTVINDMKSAIGDLNTVIGQLFNKANPVLREDPPQPQEDAPAYVPCCGVEGDLVAHKARIQELTAQLASLRDRLCV